MADPQGPPRRTPRHLIDFDNPQPRRTAAAQREKDRSLSQVQKWVMSVLAFVTIEHLAAGIAIAAIFTSARFTGARVGMNVMAGVTGILAVAAFRLIHSKSPLTPWLLVGILPGVVGAWFSFR